MLQRALVLVAVASCVQAFAAGRARANLLDPDASIRETTWAYALDGPSSGGGLTGMAWAPDGSGRLFVSRKGGQIRIVQSESDGTGRLVPVPFATETVFTDSECGLIGLALDPNFAENGFVYVFVTVSASEQQIVRYTAVGNLGTDRTELVTGLPTLGANHDGGALGIGFDGHLYWAVGDLGSYYGAETPTALPDLTSLAAKVGRARRDGSVPADNPFFDGAGPNRDFIWARGFRNPFTMTFHPVTGDLWLNVVGSNFEQAFIVTAGSNAGWYRYEANQPSTEYLRALVKYRTGGGERYEVATATRAAGVSTYETITNHYLRRGERITITGSADATFDGVAHVRSAASMTTFTVAAPDRADASSTGGIASSESYGRTIGGGFFYDGTLFPSAFRGNFFFTDYVEGRVVRVTMDDPTTVASVDPFADEQATALDVDVGPDGALYVMLWSGQIIRYSYARPTQGIVLSSQHLRLDEAGARAITVRLAVPPAADVVVDVLPQGGDPDITVDVGARLTFTPATYAVPQTVRFRAADDADRTDDSARFAASAIGLTTEHVDVSALDDDSSGIVVSTGLLAVDEGSTGRFTVALGAPRATPTVVTIEVLGDADVGVSSSTELTFAIGDWDIPQTVIVAASDDADNVDDAASISLRASGFATRTVDVTVRDDEARAPVFTTDAPTTGVVGVEYVYDAEATGTPPPGFVLGAGPPGMEIDATTGTVRWIPETPGDFAVSILAANGVTPEARQDYTLGVSVDSPPTASITMPRDGDTVSGTNEELFGDGMDDVGAERAEFFVDGALDYADRGSMGHFHHGGGHALWDTTRYEDGPHAIRFVVYDVAGQSGSHEISVIVANSSPEGTLDAGVSAAGPGGCGCRVSSARPGQLALVTALITVTTLTRRSRRQRSRADRAGGARSAGRC